MTTVPGPVNRQVGLDSFAEFTDAQVLGIDERAGVTFGGDLDEATVAVVREFIACRTDADQAARADLRTLRDAVLADPSLENVAALAVADANYMLGEA